MNDIIADMTCNVKMRSIETLTPRELDTLRGIENLKEIMIEKFEELVINELGMTTVAVEDFNLSIVVGENGEHIEIE